MASDKAKTDIDRRILQRAQDRGKLATGFAFLRLSGPGWLQSAITLGGGSLASSLYLGVLAGLSLMWLQPLFMLLGIVMLSAIGYVTLSTGERPFRAINQHINPVLGWAWALATLMANIVWSLPQFALANSVIEQNLLPDLFAEDGFGITGGKALVSAGVLVVTLLVTWCYGSGHWGIKIYEWLVKFLVAAIVISFFIVMWSLLQSGAVDWREILSGFVPTATGLFEPAPQIQNLIDQAPAEYQAFWRERVVTAQLDRVVAAAATAVGINMTFLFPYSLLRKRWSKEFRGLQKFDLATGMLIPFTLATSCILVASFAQFHAQPVQGLIQTAEETDAEGLLNTDRSPELTQPAMDGQSVVLPDETNLATAKPTAKEAQAFYAALTARLEAELGADAVAEIKSGEEPFAELLAADSEMMTGLTAARQEELKLILGQQALESRTHQLPVADQTLAATLVDRDANRLAQALAPLGDAGSANLLFGLGVVGMALSTITILMLISGFVICEMLGVTADGWKFRIASSAAAIGVLGPFVWSGAGFALAVPTSVFNFMLLPIAYLTFFLMMNQRSLLKEELPRGGRRWVWNGLMGLAVLIATLSSVYMLWQKGGVVGLGAAGGLLGLALLVQVYRWLSGYQAPAATE